MRRPKRFKLGLIAAGSLLAAAGAAVALLAVLGSRQSSAVAFSAAQQARLQRGLTAQGIPAQASVVAGEVRAQFISRGRPLLPTGSRVRIQPVTFDSRSAKTATVDAVVTGLQAGHWQLLLIKESGNWLLIGTRELR
jgi:hypothetical protein